MMRYLRRHPRLAALVVAVTVVGLVLPISRGTAFIALWLAFLVWLLVRDFLRARRWERRR